MVTLHIDEYCKFAEELYKKTKKTRKRKARRELTNKKKIRIREQRKDKFLIK